MRRRFLVLISAVTLLFVAAACGSDEPSGTGGERDEGPSHSMGGEVPGSPADAGEADREIVVETLDELRFAPPSIEIDQGETVTFVVQNVGKADHEFVLGDEAYQEMHGDDMEAEGDDMDMETNNAVTVAPGETKELTWRFDSPGEVLFGCHEPGHYEGGMVGTIRVV